MTDEDILKGLDGCFGLDDRKFAGHPSDVERAFELLTELRQGKVGWSQVKRCVSFKVGNCKGLNKSDEIKRVEKFIRPWLISD